MVSATQFPNEIWLEIFGHLPRLTLPTLALTCTRFKSMSWQLLFTHFDFHPYAVKGGSSSKSLPSRDEVSQSQKRLEFWFSDEIAHHVRSCKIAARRPMWDDRKFRETDSPYILLAPFLNDLARFTSLTKFEADGIDFTPSRMALLCRAPALAQVELVGCGFDVDTRERIDKISLPLGVSCFSFKIEAWARVVRGLNPWAPLLRPEFLHQLEFVGSPRFFGDDLAAIPTFPHAHTLIMDVNCSTMAYNLSILSKFPAVRNFTMHGILGALQDGPGVLVNTSTLLPIIQQYTCDCKAVALFFPRPTLTHLTIDLCTPEEFTAQLHATNNHIPSLDIAFDYSDIAVLQTAYTFFPTLTELRIQVDCPADQDGGLKARALFAELKKVAVALARLQRLAIVWKLVHSYDDEAVPYHAEVPKLNKLRDMIVARCRGLKRLWLDDGFSVLYWRKLPDGCEEEGTTVGYLSVETRRKDFDSFWRPTEHEELRELPVPPLRSPRPGPFRY
ncbi:hypothetical protein C8R45DRAFT_970574 [Mycena sanguinolenta]|nr:hypothetical protein C8R45DRAFT_970574 [Mycena sanguinolenta]